VATSPTDPSDPNLSDQAAARHEKLLRIEALGVDPWGGRFDGHQPIAQIRQLPANGFDQVDLPVVRAAGRIILRRTMGKVHFLELWDQTGRVQAMVGQKQVGDHGWALAEHLNRGDLVGVQGQFGKTKTGELTIRVEQLTILAKSLEPHPMTTTGLPDTEYRFRHRYLDLIYTPETLQRAQQRIKLLRTIRTYLDGLGFSEVETPTLHAIAGGAAARPFVTHHNALDIELFVRIALELHLKRLLVGGLEKVYELGRVFRNEGISQKHNPEFTMLELYQAYSDYRGMMDLTEGLIVACVDALGTSRTIPYGEHTVNFAPPWQRAAYADLFRQYVGVDMHDLAGVQQAAAQQKLEKIAAKEHDVLVQELFERCVEQHLIGPVFVYDYPAALCPLTKRKRDNPQIAERFELYVRGMELANAYTELNDPITQEAAFRRQLTGLSEEDSMAKMDDDFVHALRHGMPPAGGLGIGIDRLCMLLTNTQSIRDVILFPLLRPETK
jgi:lysyl-tRNA synthetase class 2